MPDEQTNTTQTGTRTYGQTGRTKTEMMKMTRTKLNILIYDNLFSQYFQSAVFTKLPMTEGSNECEFIDLIIFTQSYQFYKFTRDRWFE